MPSQYLTLAQAAAYGLPGATDLQLQQASALLDAYLKRPEGLVWLPDSQGQPAYMSALSATFSFTLQAPISPGANVPVSLTGPVAMLSVGDVLILDRTSSSPNVCEGCVVAGTTGPTGGIVITLQTVVNAHAEGSAAESGMVIEEKRQMPDSRPLTMMARTPLMRIHCGTGRYGYGRRGDGANYNMEQFNLLAAVSKFGGPPVWELWQPQLTNTWDVTTGQVWVPAGIMLAYYSEVKVRYVAGFQASNVPAMVSLACARIAQALQAQPSMGAVRSLKAGDTTVLNHIASVLDADTRMQLRPFMARAYS